MPVKHLKTKRDFDDNMTGSRKNKTSRNKKDGDKKHWFKRLLSWVIGLGVLGFIVGVVGFIIFASIVSRDLPNTDGLITREISESTKILDRTGEHILYEIHGDEKRTAIELEDLPPHVPNAFIAIEDKDYYQHKGILGKRLIKAVYDDVMYVLKVNLIPASVREKFNIRLNKVQGASTITQQLVKNAILTSEQSITRKLREMILAWQLEKKFTKKQILKMYLNEISYGGVNYGIESAAQSYFNKSASDLTIAESATLAALINSPTRLSPYGNYKDELIQRQKFVLSLMKDQGLINEGEYEEALNQELTFKVRTETINAPHFVMYVRSILEEELGTDYNEQLLKEGGLKIYTTLDYDIQEKAETAIKDAEVYETYDANNAALVAVDPTNGDILAMVGSRDYFDTENDGNFNAATGLRQPGSSIKPLVYASLFQKGYTPETVLQDVVTNFAVGGSGYTPKNYNLKELGPVTVRKALAGSLNIPAVKALYLVGVHEVIDFAKDLGYTTLTDPDRYGLSLVLGGAEVRLVEHVSAFGAFANEGKWNKTRSILKIEDRDGNLLEEFGTDEKRVWDKEVAAMISSVLSDNVARTYAFGADNVLVVKGKNVAAKTGTTNDYRDAWLVGYTPSFVAGVWAGNNDNTEMKRGAGGSSVAGPIWNAFMSDVLSERENESFPSPPENKSKNPALNGELVEGIKLKIDTVSGKLATENTPEELIEEKLFTNTHSILHYVNKNNPGDDFPEDPSIDPQYAIWEAAVIDWVNRFNAKAEAEGTEKIELNEPPTEEDDVHLPEYTPTVSIISHSDNDTVSGNTVTFSVNAYAPRGMSQVTYSLDDEIIGTSFNPPFDYTYEFVGVKNGFHTLQAKACDDVMNCETASIELNVLLANPYAPIEIISPRPQSSFFSTTFPLTLTAYVYDAEDITRATLYYKEVSQGQFDPGIAHAISSIAEVSNGENYIKWETPPSPGVYSIYFEVVDGANRTTQSKEISITIK